MHSCSHLSLMSLLWSLVEVHCQTAPYVTFMGNTVPNHGYVDLSLVGDDYRNGSDGVQCITDLSTCCSNRQGQHRGDWYFPDGTKRPFSGDIFEDRGSQRVDLFRRSGGNSPVGIYHCNIATEAAVHDDNNISVRDTVYVGLYTASGGDLYLHLTCSYCIFFLADISVPGGMLLTVNSDLNGASPQFTLTCISTGGPATTVSWTRDSTTVITEGTETVLNNTVTAQYTHTLTVTGRYPGLYTCTMANNKPSTAARNFIVKGELSFP